ncbi:MAG: [FeFe] hydrogenase H-cluster radical SAM maturase HydE [Rikenellaceae bacterium]
MIKKFKDISREEIIEYLNEQDPVKIQKYLNEAYKVKVSNIGNKVFLRGLIELSNICVKNCYYCGIRHDNTNLIRYELTDKQVLDAAEFAWRSRYGSLVLQAGERSNPTYTRRVTSLIKKIKEITNGEVGITLSLGEQPREVYQEWFEAGAHRYLLRIESSNPDLYNKIHPKNALHSFDRRVEAILDIKNIGYQTGTGVMIGLPYQTTGDLADDLLFIKKTGVHMVGMGPYLKHSDTPLGKLTDHNQTLDLTLKMVATLRMMMPMINIAATTAMQVIEPYGREMAVKSGANIIMPNITTSDVRANYQIYENKPGTEDDAAISKSKLEHNLKEMEIEIGWSEWGDSKAFTKQNG